MGPCVARRAYVLAWYAWLSFVAAAVGWVCGWGGLTGGAFLAGVACLGESLELRGLI